MNHKLSFQGESVCCGGGGADLLLEARWVVVVVVMSAVSASPPRVSWDSPDLPQGKREPPSSSLPTERGTCACPRPHRRRLARAPHPHPPARFLLLSTCQEAPPRPFASAPRQCQTWPEATPHPTCIAPPPTQRRPFQSSEREERTRLLSRDTTWTKVRERKEGLSTGCHGDRPNPLTSHREEENGRGFLWR